MEGDGGGGILGEFEYVCSVQDLEEVSNRHCMVYRLGKSTGAG